MIKSLQALLRSKIIKESVIYQEIPLDGKAETTHQMVPNMLESNIYLDLVTQFTRLNLKQIQKLQKLSAKQSPIPNTPKPKRSSTP